MLVHTESVVGDDQMYSEPSPASAAPVDKGELSTADLDAIAKLIKQAGEQIRENMHAHAVAFGERCAAASQSISGCPQGVEDDQG